MEARRGETRGARLDAKYDSAARHRRETSDSIILDRTYGNQDVKTKWKCDWMGNESGVS